MRNSHSPVEKGEWIQHVFACHFNLASQLSKMIPHIEKQKGTGRGILLTINNLNR